MGYTAVQPQVTSYALILFNSDVQNVIQTAPDLGVDAAQQLAGLELTDTTLQTNILNQAFDADFVSTGEAYQGVIITPLTTYRLSPQLS